jgi:hypothetical protein
LDRANLLEVLVSGVPWQERPVRLGGKAVWSATGKLPILKFLPALVFDPSGFAHVLKVAADIARLGEIKTANALRGLGVSVVLHIPDQAGPPCLALSIGMALGFAMAGSGAIVRNGWKADISAAWLFRTTEHCGGDKLLKVSNLVQSALEQLERSGRAERGSGNPRGA